MSNLSKIPKKYKNRKIYSFSKLTTFEQCQYQYYLGYIEGLEGKSSIYSVLGSLIHEQTELLQQRKITNIKALQNFKDKLLEMELSGKIKFISKKVEDNYKQCLYHYLIYYKPFEATKTALEKEFYTEIEGIIVRGFIDIILLHEESQDKNLLPQQEISIIDYKTSSKYSGNEEKKHALQLILYAYAMERIYKAKIKMIGWNMLKYATVTYFKDIPPKTKKNPVWSVVEKVKICLRNEIVIKHEKEIITEMQKLNKSDIEIELALRSDEIPKEIAEKFKIEDCIVTWDYNKEEKNRLIDFIINTVKEIENRKNKEEFLAVEINNGTKFYCEVLCDYSEYCEQLKKYKEETQSENNLLEDLFG